MADDIIFVGDVVDDICWNVTMYAFFNGNCAQGEGFDSTWEIRVYESDATGGIGLIRQPDETIGADAKQFRPVVVSVFDGQTET